MTVVVSELRDNARGRDILGDFSGVANQIAAHLLHPDVDRDAVHWVSHHGDFSSYDPAGPEIMYHIPLIWDGSTYLPLDVQTISGEHRLDDIERQSLDLDPVDKARAHAIPVPP